MAGAAWAYLSKSVCLCVFAGFITEAERVGEGSESCSEAL